MTVVHAWEGAVTDDGFRVVAKVTGSSTRLAYDDNSGLTSPTYTAAEAPTADGIVSFTVTGLDPSTPYWWAIEDDATLDADHRGHLTTFPTVGEPASFTFAAAACAGRDGAYETLTDISNAPVFDTIRTTAPLFFLHMGDLHYYDINTADIDLYRGGYDDVLAQARQEQLYREVPLVYMWDDHDFGPNNSDRTSPGRDQACLAYRERVPHYPVPASGPVYQSFQVGRVLFVITDLRADRDPNADTDDATKTMLGATQKAWFINLLETSTAEALVWCSTTPYLASGAVADSWALYTNERTEIAAALAANGWTDRMCMVSGDIHALAIDNGSNNAWGGFPIFHFASLDSSNNSRGGPYTYGPAEGKGQWGTIEVEDNGGVITITGTGYIDSTAWNSYSFGAVNPRPWTDVTMLTWDGSAWV